MIKLSANLGLLWRERDLPEAMQAAAWAGFEALELHFPYDLPVEVLKAGLDNAGLPLLGLNTAPGARAGDFGLAALAGREEEARAAIDQALSYAKALGARHLHVMPGKAEGPAARNAFIEALAYATQEAEAARITIVIEPLNQRDVPGYFLTDLDLARDLIQAVGAPNLKIMYDCYHRQIMRGDHLAQIKAALADIAHIQFAAVPDRGEPDAGELDYGWLLPAIQDLGYGGLFGAEYRPRLIGKTLTPTHDGLAWLEDWRSQGLLA